MYNPLKYYTHEAMKNLSSRAKEILSYLYPPITMYEEGGEIYIEADLPGFDKKDIKVRSERDSITIQASRKIEPKGGSILSNQRPENVFKRVRIPYEMDEDAELTAKYVNGVLTVKVPAKGFKTVKVE